MISLSEFQSLVGKKLYYSDMYDRQYSIIEPISISRKPRKGSRNAKLGYFSFNAKIIESFGYGDNNLFNKPGSIHSYGNSFIFKSFRDLQDHCGVYKAQQIAFLTAVARKEGIIA